MELDGRHWTIAASFLEFVCKRCCVEVFGIRYAQGCSRHRSPANWRCIAVPAEPEPKRTRESELFGSASQLAWIKCQTTLPENILPRKTTILRQRYYSRTSSRYWASRESWREVCRNGFPCQAARLCAMHHAPGQLSRILRVLWPVLYDRQYRPAARASVLASRRRREAML